MKDYKSEWIAQMLALPSLTHEKVVALHRKYLKTGRLGYRNQILMAHLRQAINPASHYASRLSEDIFFDLINASSLAIIRAINKWDPDRGTYFFKFVKIFIWRACYNTYHNYNNLTYHSSSILNKKENIIDINDLRESQELHKNLTEEHKIGQISSWDDYDYLTSGLTKREKKIIDFYILDELPWKKISKIMRISPKKMTDIHKDIFAKIKVKHQNTKT